MSEQLIKYIFLIITGASFGSFFNVCIYRIPRKESIVFPASHCPKCGVKIKPWNNIPIISFIVLGRKCKSCGNAIHWHYLLVEILTPIIFILIFIRFGFSFLFVKYIIFFSFGIIIFFIDLFKKIVPDVLSLPLIIIGIVFSLFPSNDITLLYSISGALLGFIIFLFTAYVFRIILKKDSLGGGDIKLITAIGSFTGIIGMVFTIFCSSAAALIILIILKHDREKEFPFGPFLILGTFFYVVAGNYLLNLYLNLF
ncbi:MAG: prepilin peptidase [Candidatus Cloacimonetes bacterium]|nr:prepilin peptidase [Candidatus Cloacimonadota bacterium]